MTHLYLSHGVEVDTDYFWIVILALLIFPWFPLVPLRIYRRAARQQFRVCNQLTRKSESPDPDAHIKYCCGHFRVPTTSMSAIELWYSRRRSRIMRMRFVCVQLAICLMLYAFPDSLFVDTISDDRMYYFNVPFHGLQLFCLLLYFRCSLMNPGFIALSRKSRHKTPSTMNTTTKRGGGSGGGTPKDEIEDIGNPTPDIPTNGTMITSPNSLEMVATPLPNASPSPSPTTSPRFSNDGNARNQRKRTRNGTEELSDIAGSLGSNFAGSMGSTLSSNGNDLELINQLSGSKTHSEQHLDPNKTKRPTLTLNVITGSDENATGNEAFSVALGGDSPLDETDRDSPPNLPRMGSIRNNNAKDTFSFEPIIIDVDNSPSSYCWRCQSMRPIRSKHDRNTDRCVARYDHHDTILGNTVGAYNHCTYVLLLCTQTIIAFAAAGVLGLLLHGMKEEGSDDLMEWILVCLFVVYLSGSAFMVCGVCGVHSYLVSTNKTIYEMIKPQVKRQYLQFMKDIDKENEYMKSYEDRFSRGCCRNWCSALCGYRFKKEYFRTMQCLLIKEENNEEESSSGEEIEDDIDDEEEEEDTGIDVGMGSDEEEIEEVDKVKQKKIAKLRKRLTVQEEQMEALKEELRELESGAMPRAGPLELRAARSLSTSRREFAKRVERASPSPPASPSIQIRYNDDVEDDDGTINVGYRV